MKRFLLFLVVVGLFAGQASAQMWELDHATALQFTNSALLLPNPDGDTMGALSIHPFGTLGYGSTHPIQGTVGFKANLVDGTGTPDTTVGADVYAYNAMGLGLVGLGYDGITARFGNDNNTAWDLQLQYTDAIGTHTSGAFVSVTDGTSQYLTASSTSGPGTLNLSTITRIGFTIKHSGIDAFSDDFHVSVPVPGAVLLGMLGLSVAGIKLRKFA